MGNREGDGLLIGNILSIFSLRSFNCEENSIVRKIVLIEENSIICEENSINCEENSIYCDMKKIVFIVICVTTKQHLGKV